MSKSNLMVKKHTATIHIKGDLSLVQRKMMNALLLQAYENLSSQNIHSVDYQLLCSYMNFDSNNVDHIKESLHALLETVIIWDYFGINGKKVWEASTLLSSYKIENGIIYYSYSPTLIDKIYTPEVYSRINISTVSKLNSKYSVALYENCFRYVGSKTTGWIDIDKFKGLMGIDYGAYYFNKFYLFKDKVLNPSIKEINNSSDIIINPEYQTKGRKIISIKFNISKKPDIIKEVIVNDKSSNSEILDDLLSFNISKKVAQDLIDKHGEEYLKEKMMIVEKMQKDGKVKSSASGLFISAVENNFKDPRIEAEKEAKILSERIKNIKNIEYLLQELERDKRNIDRSYKHIIQDIITDKYTKLPEINQKNLCYEFSKNLDEMRLIDFRKSNWKSSLNYLAIRDFWVQNQALQLPDIEESANKEGVKSYVGLLEKIEKLKNELESLRNIKS